MLQPGLVPAQGTEAVHCWNCTACSLYSRWEMGGTLGGRPGSPRDGEVFAALTQLLSSHPLSSAVRREKDQRNAASSIVICGEEPAQAALSKYTGGPAAHQNKPNLAQKPACFNTQTPLAASPPLSRQRAGSHAVAERVGRRMPGRTLMLGLKTRKRAARAARGARAGGRPVSAARAAAPAGGGAAVAGPAARRLVHGLMVRALQQPPQCDQMSTIKASTSAAAAAPQLPLGQAAGDWCVFPRTSSRRGCVSKQTR